MLKRADSGECPRRFRGMLLKIRGYAIKDSGRQVSSPFPRKFLGLNVRNFQNKIPCLLRASNVYVFDSLCLSKWCNNRVSDGYFLAKYKKFPHSCLFREMLKRIPGKEMFIKIPGNVQEDSGEYFQFQINLSHSLLKIKQMFSYSRRRRLSLLYFRKQKDKKIISFEFRLMKIGIEKKIFED